MENSLDKALILKRLAEPFFVEGPTTLQVSTCCGFVFVGVRPASSCKHCGKVPDHFQLNSLDDLDGALKFLNLPG